jgi:hypothetical protein
LPFLRKQESGKQQIKTIIMNHNHNHHNKSASKALQERLRAETDARNILIKTSILKLLYVEDGFEKNTLELFQYLSDIKLVKSQEDFQTLCLELKFEGLLIIYDEKLKLTGSGMKKANE